MYLPLDPKTGPLFRQIEQQLREQIEEGRYPPGARLPSTRQLAEELGVSRITVKNAYAELESDGLIGPREGSGTYVLPPCCLCEAGTEDEAGQTWPLWQVEALAQNPPPPTERPPLGDGHPAPVDFTGAGDPRLFPAREFMQTMAAVIRHDGAEVLGYGPLQQQCPSLRHTIAQMLTNNGILCTEDEILLTTGSQQALALVCHALLKRGDAVLVEDPSYNFALALFRTLGLKLIGVPVDAEGMCVELIEPLLQKHRPRLIYTMPNFQNPTGACLSGERRRQLLALADRYNIPILEDDYAGDLRYEGRAQPAIKRLDPGGRVIYVGSFSKMLMPGLRVGYLLAEGPIRGILARHKRVTDLATSPLILRALEHFMSIGRYQAHLRRAGRAYGKRRDALLAAIRRHLPASVRIEAPQGGLFAWLQLPAGIDAEALLDQARRSGVLFAPGSRFFIEPAKGLRFIRLNFATRTPDEIDLGIARLAQALKASQP
ncbi:MAG: PLP-dependent aminotransferase family protein [Uliginosibacterium sp.]|nr:PLP-dependent aminotransferase family protein [Uliginosibacterium sp.]